ncbi:MAG: S9 family peptidase [candidate division KSB1 bacterium]
MIRLKNSLLLVINVLFVIPAWAQQQSAERALYDFMVRERLTTTNGPRSVEWLPEGSGYFVSEEDAATKSTSFFRVDPATQKRTPLFDQATQQSLVRGYNNLTKQEIKNLPLKSFTYLPGGAAITFSIDKRYFHYDFKSAILREFLRPTVAPQPGSKDLMRGMAASQLWNGEYAPDFSHFAYVKEFDLYLVNTSTGEEKRLTFGGNENLLHGRPDWVYPEEFAQLTAYWWSPDGRKLAYYEFDESQVHKYPLVHDLKPEAEVEMQSYPKAGETNPTVKLFIVDIATGKNVEIPTNSSSDVYLIKPKWLPDGSGFTFQRMNRRQNELELLVADRETGATRALLVEKEEAFINLHDDFIVLQDGKHFLWSSERSGWRHLYLYDLQGQLVRQLTKGEWPVEGITQVDEKNKWIYFTGYTNDGLELHFFRVNLEGTKQQQLTSAPGTHRVSLDPACKYFTDSYSAFTTPPTMNVHSAEGKLLNNLMSTNTARLDSLKLLPPELVLVKAADGTTDLHGLLFKPANFDPNKRYPLYVSVYGGPHSKSVRNSYQTSSSAQRMAQLGFIVWTQDNRGLVNRGKKFETETYMKLGQVDLADQTAGVKQITQRSYVDGSRVGVFGWSYGGYMTSIMMLKEPEVFHVGIAGAPVTDWRNYDTIYTERYMRTPQENTEGYDLGSALPYAKNLKGKLLILHGSVDNNVHPGNTIQLLDALIKAQKKFDLTFYPEQRHGVGGPGAQHVNSSMIDFLLEHLKSHTPATAL